MTESSVPTPTALWSMPESNNVHKVVSMFMEAHASVAKTLSHRASTTIAYRAWMAGYLPKAVKDNLIFLPDEGRSITLQLPRLTSPVYGTTKDSPLLGWEASQTITSEGKRKAPESPKEKRKGTEAPSEDSTVMDSLAEDDEEAFEPADRSPAHKLPKLSFKEKKDAIRIEKRTYEEFQEFHKSVPIAINVFLNHMDVTLRATVINATGWREAETNCDLLRCWHIILHKTIFAVVEERDFGPRLRSELMTAPYYKLTAGGDFHTHCNKWTTAREMMTICESLTEENEQFIAREFVNSLPHEDRFNTVRLEFTDTQGHRQYFHEEMRNSINEVISRITFLCRATGATTTGGRGGRSASGGGASGGGASGGGAPTDNQEIFRALVVGLAQQANNAAIAKAGNEKGEQNKDKASNKGRIEACRNFLHGKCSSGSGCRYSHGASDTRIVNGAFTAAAKTAIEERTAQLRKSPFKADQAAKILATMTGLDRKDMEVFLKSMGNAHP
jgi:hypothetical protein